MRTQALISRALAALASGTSRRPSAPIAMAKPSAPVLFRNWRRSMSRLLGRALDGGDDAVVGAAAADVAVHVLDDLLARRVLVSAKQLGRLHDLAGLAVAALRHLLGDPGFLQWMRAIGRQALDGRHARPLDGSERRGARAHRLAVDMHGARAAERRTAAELRSGELDLIADYPEMRRAVLCFRGDRLAVELERDHRVLLCRQIFAQKSGTEPDLVRAPSPNSGLQKSGTEPDLVRAPSPNSGFDRRGP